MSFAQLDQRLETLLDEVSARADVHSVAMTVASGSGDFRWSGARGELAAGGAAATPGMPWFTASITKLFIAATVMRMVEDGELALDDFRPVPEVVGHTGSTGTWLFHARKLDLYMAGTVNQITAGAVPFRLVPKILRAARDTRAR